MWAGLQGPGPQEVGSSGWAVRESGEIRGGARVKHPTGVCPGSQGSGIDSEAGFGRWGLRWCCVGGSEVDPKAGPCRRGQGLDRLCGSREPRGWSRPLSGFVGLAVRATRKLEAWTVRHAGRGRSSLWAGLRGRGFSQPGLGRTPCTFGYFINTRNAWRSVVPTVSVPPKSRLCVLIMRVSR